MHRAMFALAVLLNSYSAFGAFPFELPVMNGEGTYKSQDHGDAVFVVEAFFDNCGWCHKNAPRINTLAESYTAEPRVQFLDVGVDYEDSEYEHWIATTTPNHPVLADPKKQLLKPFKIQGYPTTLVLDCKGEVVFRHEGYFSEGTSELKTAIDNALLADCH